MLWPRVLVPCCCWPGTGIVKCLITCLTRSRLTSAQTVVITIVTPLVAPIRAALDLQVLLLCQPLFCNRVEAQATVGAARVSNVVVPHSQYSHV